jgi:hypothetical protein
MKKGPTWLQEKTSLFLLPGHALFEPITLLVHGQDVSMLGGAIQYGTRELLTVEDLGPRGEIRVRGHDNGLPLIAIGNCLEEEFGSPFREGNVADLGR